jgi:hypothetical protein
MGENTEEMKISSKRESEGGAAARLEEETEM